MSKIEIRATASNILDGMTFNKEKLANQCIALCDVVDGLEAKLCLEVSKNNILTLEIDKLKKQIENRSKTNKDEMFGSNLKDLPPGFRDIFRKSTKQNY